MKLFQFPNSGFQFLSKYIGPKLWVILAKFIYCGFIVLPMIYKLKGTTIQFLNMSQEW